jgi:predicted lipid-binding transport protein (Tim44 family)
MSSEFIDIFLFGLIAVFLVYRLKNILGSTDGKIINLKSKKPQSKFKPKIVPKNDNEEFLKGADKAYEMIVQAYQSNNIANVKDLLTPEALRAMEQAKAPKEIKFSEVKSSSIIEDKSDDQRLVKSVKFETDHYNVANNEILTVVEEWGFEKDKTSSDPNWKLFSIKLVS